MIDKMIDILESYGIIDRRDMNIQELCSLGLALDDIEELFLELNIEENDELFRGTRKVLDNVFDIRGKRND